MGNRMAWERVEWDSRFFGFPIARILNLPAGEAPYRDTIASMRKAGVRVAYYAVPADQRACIDIVEHNGTEAVCTQVEWRHRLEEMPTGERDSRIRTWDERTPSDALIRLGLQSGTFSRFSIDSRFGNVAFRKLYHEWISRSVDKTIADEVFVLFNGEDLGGFITVKKENFHGGIGLVGVAVPFRRGHVGTQLIQESLRWFKKRGCSKASVTTQQDNHGACRMYEKNGFFLQARCKYYHLWL